MPIQSLKCIGAFAILFGSRLLADEVQTAEQRFKNIQVLKGIPVDEFGGCMNFISNSLGVECSFCHDTTARWPQGYEKDDLKAKQTAREMITMTKRLNAESFGGRNVITCANCHHGQAHPQPFLFLESPEGLKEALAHPVQKPASPLPSADELFARFQTAIGGDALISKLITRHVIATVSGPGRPAMKVEFFFKVNDRFLQVQKAGSITAKIGFDGTNVYTSTDTVFRATGAAADGLRLTGLFQRTLRLKDLYKDARTVRKERLSGRDVYVVEAAFNIERYSDLLSFDADSGLLLRRTTFSRTPLGPLPQTVDYENYRDVDGIKVAMDEIRSSLAGRPPQRMHFEQVRFNDPMEDAMFAMPASPGK